MIITTLKRTKRFELLFAISDLEKRGFTTLSGIFEVDSGDRPVKYGSGGNESPNTFFKVKMRSN